MTGWPSEKSASPWNASEGTNIDKLSDDDLIVHWKQSQTDAKIAVARELEYRNAVIARKFGNDKSDGTKNIELGKGWKLKAVFKTSYNPDDDKVDETLEAMRKAGPEGVVYAGRIFGFKASLKLSEYKQLPAQFKALIDAIITTKPAQPSLELISPDDKKK